MLLGHLNRASDSLDTAIAEQDENALIVAADPLVTVAAILIRMLRDLTDGTVESALALTRQHFNTNVIPADQLHSVESLIIEIISGNQPEPIQVRHTAVAIIAHDLATSAAGEISAIDGRHVNKVIADLRIQLKQQGDQVQISDRLGATEAVNKYASDEAMQKARTAAAFESINYWQKAAYDLHVVGLREDISNNCQDSLEGLALVAVTTKTLASGVFQLARLQNIYPAWALVRQIVESEFIVWKFAQLPTQIPLWLHSTDDERRQNWRPAQIYRDDDNTYRQKDYWAHCERGGHLTPRGARMASQGKTHPIMLASLLTELTDHLYDAWRHLLRAVGAIDIQFNIDVSNQLAMIASAYETSIKKWRSIDHFKHATSYFPIQSTNSVNPPRSQQSDEPCGTSSSGDGPVLICRRQWGRNRLGSKL